MALQSLLDIYREKGSDYLNLLFNQQICVTEKLNGSTFYLQCKNSQPVFFKKDINYPINLIDRTINLFWERPLLYLESLNLNKLPEGWKFQFEYFYCNKPVFISYDSVPSNNLVLTAIWDAAENLVDDIEIINYWADFFQITKPPIIFQGLLNQEQKNELLAFISTPKDQLVSKYGTEKFTTYLIKLLAPGLTKTTLNSSFDSNIEALVFRFGDSTVESYHIMDPIVAELTKLNKINTKTEPNHIYSLILIDLFHFISDIDLNFLQLKTSTADSRYLELICLLFNQFMKLNADSYKGLKFELPEYMSDEIFSVNVNGIPNIKTIELIEMAPENAEIFKILLASFRKKRKKPNSIFNQYLLDQFNILVDKINLKINGINSVVENKLPTYSELKKLQLITEDLFFEFEPVISSELEITDYPESTEEIISPISSKENENNNDNPFINVIILDFLPNLDTIEYIKQLEELHECKLIIYFISSNELQCKIMTEFLNENFDLIIDLRFKKRLLFSEIIKECNIFSVKNIFVPVKWEDFLKHQSFENPIIKPLPLMDTTNLIRTFIESKDFVGFSSCFSNSVINNWLDLNNQF